MKRSRAWGVLSVLASIVACVGDDPDSATTPGADAGPNATSDAVANETGTSLPDAGGDEPSTDAVVAWTPAALGTALVTWLDAAQGVTVTAGKVATWGDRTSYKNDARQTSAAAQPALEAAALNGLPAITFAPGTQLTIADAASLQWGLGDFTVEVVAKFVNSTVGSYVAF